MLKGLGVITEIDPLFGMSNEEVSRLVAENQVAAVDVVMHNYINQFIRRAIRTYNETKSEDAPEYLDQDLDVIEKDLVALAESKLLTLPNQSTDFTDNLLAVANA